MVYSFLGGVNYGSYAKIFQNGRSQRFVCPKVFRLKGNEVSNQAEKALDNT
jgi:hypothetical protein